MAFCLAELHCWSSSSSLQVKARGYSWTPRNRRPEKLRDSLEKLEELLQTNSVVHSRWKSKHCCQLMLSSGVLVTLALNGPQLDRVCVDRTLVGRLPANTVSDAVLSDRLLLLSFLEKSQVCVIYLNRKNQGSPDTSHRLEKLSPSELKAQYTHTIYTHTEHTHTAHTH
uniref:Uncharacterized protein n=1 Tax=Hucho hucho TaxID=62062 RepID=A0A4W5JZ39_9TELE